MHDMCLYIELFLQNHIINTYCFIIWNTKSCFGLYVNTNVAKYRNVFSCFWYCKTQKKIAEMQKREQKTGVYVIFFAFLHLLQLFALFIVICQHKCCKI